MPATVKRPLWSLLLPQTYTSRVHALAFHAPTIVFMIAVCAIVSKQSYYRSSLADEDPKTYDRIDRRAYVALPDGRMALVYPIIDTQTSFTRTVISFLDAVNPFP
ncbi:Succinate dehydrogenase subunit 3 [Leishmania donovani]|uniref:Uncharacterized protein n=3 Tax=Leishmania donovani species complex TaxID=38574 RepID=A4I5W3_LEIIN|nr:conserved hypothetical protein [Leishmania infantum JPCM5]XP_003862997.1 hypothetical protein, conserved [Leishmania donovani]CAC9515243.1 hypothetical_protein_-_conserved [Leishmania infantum]AYU81086.1 hypothetical protein LdCL_300034200 [Leishmania donovani]TPP45835.1 hypothetical protein CGC21_36130 [Leishmania donovani]CAJ1991078.1 Succinate dehydrogenase subunit 3 [Leishmania donovani]CAM70185.1 conserved hypothetical protein [Leishmania infantum JPCM5]|eukprot:XP_001467132.1 conserved hypothetical protein [Leishmania infantum JPCM5]